MVLPALSSNGQIERAGAGAELVNAWCGRGVSRPTGRRGTQQRCREEVFQAEKFALMIH